MKKLYPLLSLFVFTLLVHCSNDKPTTPDEPEETLLTSATIGAGGGTLGTADFSLIIPAGALTSEVGLSLYDAGDDHTFGNNALSPVYRIKGLPEEFSEPLQVSLRYDGTLSEETYIALGTEEYFVEVDDELLVYDFLSAADSSGFLLAEIPVPPSGVAREIPGTTGKNAVTTATEKLDFLAIANHKLYIETNLFKIYYPVYLIDYVDDIAQYLKDAFLAVSALGLGYQDCPWTWPIDIAIEKLKGVSPESRIGIMLPTKVGGRPKIIFDAEHLGQNELPKYKTAASSGMVAMAQAIYDQTGGTYFRPAHAWLHSAVGVWGGGLTQSNPSTFVPTQLAGKELKIFSGLGAGGGLGMKPCWEHGKGLCPVIKFLMGDSRFGNAGLLRCYQYIKNGDDAMTALLDALSNTEDDWFPDFFRQYLQGNIYNVGGDVFTASTNIAGTMNTKTDTLKEFPATYQDLSAKLYYIDLDSTTLPTAASMSFEVDATQTNADYVTTQIYRIKDNKLEFITEGLNVTVGGVKESAKEGYDLIACVVNASNEEPYTGSSPLELTIRTVRQLPYNWCRIDVGAMSFYVHKSDGTYEWKTDQGYSWEGQGSFTGNTFTSTYDGPDQYDPGIYRAGNLSVTLDPQTLNVTAFSGQQTLTRYSGTIQTVAGISGGTVRFYETGTSPNPHLSCAESGNDACATITSLPYRYDWFPAQYWEDKQAQAHICTSESTVWITFWEWYGN